MRTLWLVFLLVCPALGHAGWLFEPTTVVECVDEYAKSANVGRLVPVIRSRCAEAFDLGSAPFYRARRLCEASGLASAKHVELIPVIAEECQKKHPDPVCREGEVFDPFKPSHGCIDVDFFAFDPYRVITRKGATSSGVGDDGVTPVKSRGERLPPELVNAIHHMIERMGRDPLVDQACERVREGLAQSFSGTRIHLTLSGGKGGIVGCSFSYSVASESVPDEKAQARQVMLTTTKNGTMYIYTVSE